MSRFLAAILCVGIPAFVSAQPDPKPPAKVVTRVHDLQPVLAAKSRPADLANSDDVVRLILETLSLGDLKPDGDGPRLVVLDGNKLEVRTTEATQDEIKDLIAALARLGDLAVDLKAKLIELDRTAYDKLVKLVPQPAYGTPDDDNELPAEIKKTVDRVNEILKAGKVIQTSTGRFANGAESLLSSRQSVLSFPTGAGIKPLTVKTGYRLSGLLVVSADRRFVRCKLTEQAAEVVGIKKRELGEIGGKPLVATTPVVSDFGRIGTVEVADGGTMLFRLDYAPKDKAWIVVLQPRIFIQAEEDEFKKQEKK